LKYIAAQAVRCMYTDEDLEELRLSHAMPEECFVEVFGINEECYQEAAEYLRKVHKLPYLAEEWFEPVSDVDE